jgi:hypothetical protein
VTSGRSVTTEFYKNSFQAAELLHINVLGSRMEAGRLLEIGVLADLTGQPATETL